MPKIFNYNSFDDNNLGVVVEITEEEILQSYWSYWVEQMLKVHKLPMITEQNCIEDFVIANWAWEIK